MATLPIPGAFFCFPTNPFPLVPLEALGLFYSEQLNLWRSSGHPLSPPRLQSENHSRNRALDPLNRPGRVSPMFVIIFKCCSCSLGLLPFAVVQQCWEKPQGIHKALGEDQSSL